MARLTSTLRLAAAGLLTGAVMMIPAASSQAQSVKALFTRPFYAEQVAFANGFAAAVKYVNEEISGGRMTPKDLAALAANRENSLVVLVVAKAKDYQQKLIQMNPRHPAVLKARQKGPAPK